MMSLVAHRFTCLSCASSKGGGVIPVSLSGWKPLRKKLTQGRTKTMTKTGWLWGDD